MQPLALGIDLGGTNLRIGVVDLTGAVREFVVRPIAHSLSGPEIVETIRAQALELESFHSTAGVGVALAASVLHGDYLIEDHTTLPGLGGFPLKKRLASKLEKPCLIDNDANLALLAEAHFGAAQNYSNVLLLTLGTGIGGGLLLGGRLYYGSHSSGSEIGLSLVQGPNGKLVPIEELASPGALMQKLGDPRGKLFERAASGDPTARILIDEMFEYLGMLVTNLHLLLDLELVLLSGGLASVGAPLRDGVQAAFEKLCPPGLQFGLQIALGGLPAQSAGVIGAASLWFEYEGWLPRLSSRDGDVR